MLVQALIVEFVSVLVGLTCAKICVSWSSDVTDRQVALRYARNICFAAITFRIPASGADFPCSQSQLVYFSRTENIAPLQHVIGHGIHCPACCAARDELMRPSVLGDLPLRVALDRWLDDKKLYIQPRTTKDYQQYFQAINAFMGEAITKEVHIGLIVEYQKHRIAQNVGPVRINHEVLALSQFLRSAKRWDNYIKPYYKKLPEPKVQRGTAITKEQAETLFKVAKGNPYWQVALYASIISINTTAGPGEIRNLQMIDVNLQERKLFIRKGVKNRYRVRELPLNDDALRAVTILYRRAAKNGCIQPDHYLLPARTKIVGQQYDPTKPQMGWHKSWHKMRTAAGLPTLRIYDLRHTSITWALADPTVPDQALVEVAGWVDPAMIRRYSHQKMQAKMLVVQALQQLNLGLTEPKKPVTNAQFTWQLGKTISNT